MPVPDYGNVPAQPQYGEVQQIDAQVAGAALPKAEEPPVAAPAPVAPDMSQSVYQPSPNNIVDVLPPANTAPAVTGLPPLRPEQQLAYLILGTPGMGGLTRSFAAQIVGRYPVEASIPAEQLPPDALADLQERQIAEQLRPQGV
jgi:hypothetical protein